MSAMGSSESIAPAYRNMSISKRVYPDAQFLSDIRPVQIVTEAVALLVRRVMKQSFGYAAAWPCCANRFNMASACGARSERPMKPPPKTRAVLLSSE